MVKLVGSNSLGLSKVIDGKAQYIHIKYSAYEDGMIMTDTAAEDTKFIGVLVTFNSQPSPIPGDYSWARFVVPGDKGADGVAGASSYTWIRYSPNANGSSMTPKPEANSLYIGVAITSENSAPGANTEYTWALIKGADGKGVKSAAITYQAGTSGTVIPTGSWGPTVPTVPKGGYLWTRVITTYTDNTVSLPSYSTSYQGVDGITNVTGLLTNESITLPANVSGTVATYTGATGTFDVFEGLTKNTGPGVEYSVLSKTNIEVTIATTGVYTITSMTSGLATLNGFATLRAIYNGVTIDKQVSVTKAPTGATGATGGTGATGDSATSYWITASNNIIGKSQIGVINPTTITFKGFSKTGTANSVAYSGRFIIQTSTNGTTYTNSYTSLANENSYTYTIPADSLFVKCLFYLADGTTVLLDEQTVPIVETAQGIEVGGRNLLANSGRTITNGTYNIATYNFTIPPSQGDLMTVTIKGNLASTKSHFAIHNSGGSVSLGSLKSVGGGLYTLTFNWSIGASSNTFLSVYAFTNAQAGVSTIEWIKLEKGTVATDWTAAPEDARTYKAWANSSDGTVDFTRVYPNENLISKDVVIDKSSIDATGVVIPAPHTFTTEKIGVTSGVEYTIKNHSALAGETIGIIEYNSSGTMTKYDNILYGAGTVKLASTTTHVRANVGTPGGEYNNDVKLEQGTTPTIYTTNPGDSLTGSVPKYVGFSPLDSDKPSDYEWIINPEWTQASAEESLTDKADKGEIDNINNALGGKVNNDAFDELKATLELFQDSYEGFVNDGGQHEQDLIDLEGRMTELLLSLDSKVLELDFLKTYMKFGEEGFMIGKDDSQIKMLLKNDRLSFMDAGQEVAFFSGQSFYINRGAIVQSLQVGEHKLTNLGNGHTIFQWVG